MAWYSGDVVSWQIVRVTVVLLRQSDHSAWNDWLQLGRQAAEMFAVNLFGGTVSAVAVFCDCLVLGLWMRASTRSSSCLAAGCNRGGVVWIVGGTVLAVAVFCDCLNLGLWMRGLNSVVKLLGGRVQSRLVSSSWLVASVLAVAVICDCLALGSVCGAQTRSSSCLAAGYNSGGVVKLVGGTVHAVAVFSDREVVVMIFFVLLF